MAKTQLGQCALCRQKKELQLSHIVPHFVGRKLIKTAPGNIRSTNEPNKIAQDIEKHFMLCHECEELFSAKERWFASNIFNPRQDRNEGLFNYDDNLTYFIISLSWRSLYLDLEEFVTDKNFDKEILLILLRAEQIMREYLLGKRQDIELIQNHIFFLDRIKSAKNIDVSQHPSVAMHRSISSYTAYNGKTSFTVSNLLGILVVTFYSMDINEEWVNTRISAENGIIEARNQKMASVVGQEIQHWMKQSEEAMESLSENQKQKINTKFVEVGDDIKKFPIYQDWLDEDELKKTIKRENL